MNTISLKKIKCPVQNHGKRVYIGFYVVELCFKNKNHLFKLKLDKFDRDFLVSLREKK